MIEILTNVEGQNVFNTANKVATDKEDNIDFKKVYNALKSLKEEMNGIGEKADKKTYKDDEKRNMEEYQETYLTYINTPCFCHNAICCNREEFIHVLDSMQDPDIELVQGDANVFLPIMEDHKENEIWQEQKIDTPSFEDTIQTKENNILQTNTEVNITKDQDIEIDPVSTIVNETVNFASTEEVKKYTDKTGDTRHYLSFRHGFTQSIYNHISNKSVDDNSKHDMTLHRKFQFKFEDNNSNKYFGIELIKTKEDTPEIEEASNFALGFRQLSDDEIEDITDAGIDGNNIISKNQFQDVLATVNSIEDDIAMDIPQRIKIIHQLSEKIYTNLDNDSSEMIVQLKPEILGKVILKVVLDDNMLSAKIVTQSYETRDMIVAQIDELRNALNEQGYILANLDVDVNQDGSQARYFYNSRQNTFNTKLDDDFSNYIPIEDRKPHYNKSSIHRSVLEHGSIDYLA